MSWLDLLTIACVGMRFVFGVYAVEVEQFVVVAWIHDYSAVCVIPNHQVVPLLYDGPCDWIVKAGLSWDQEAESGLA
jgi:hypothetical protein